MAMLEGSYTLDGNAEATLAMSEGPYALDGKAEAIHLSAMEQ